MTHKASGKSSRKGIRLVGLMRKFPDDDASRNWLERQIWPGGPHCPRWGTLNVRSGIKHKTMTHRCRECPGKPRFSLKTGNVMEGSKLGYRTWVPAIYLISTNLKSVSSMKLRRDLEVTQKTAWHLAHRLRDVRAAAIAEQEFSDPVEGDETYVCGKRKSKVQRQAERTRGNGARRRGHGGGCWREGSRDKPDRGSARPPYRCATCGRLRRRDNL